MEGMAPADSEMPSFGDFFGRSLDMISLSHIIFKNMAHVRSNSHFVFVIVIVFVFVNFVGHVMSPHHSHHMSKGSQVSQSAVW